MAESTYPMAREVAAVAEAEFARLHAVTEQQAHRERGPLPTGSVVRAVVDSGFWASLKQEEGRSPKISLALLPPEQAGLPLTFGQRLALTPEALSRLAPAVERPGIHLGVWHDGGDLYVWGATRTLPDLCFVLEVVEPGLLVVKYSRNEELGKFGNVAVVHGDQVKIVDERGIHESWLLGSDVLVQMAISMRAHKHGGALLVVPAGSRQWQESIASPLPYRITPPFSRLKELVQRSPEETTWMSWQADARKVIDGVAGLTAVDGATVMNDGYELLAFGAKLQRSQGSAPIERVVLVEPVVGFTPTVIGVDQLGGTRHLSAAQFVHDQRGTLALVASQDGRFTVFAWSALDEIVQAHRLETLLL